MGATEVKPSAKQLLEENPILQYLSLICEPQSFDQIVMGASMIPRTNLFAPIVLLVLLVASEDGGATKTSITCMTCTPKAGQPTWCSRGENKGTVKKCTGDSLNPRNTCFKTVNKKTGEVERGCAPPTLNHGIETKMSTGLNGEKDITTYLCNKDYCNSGNMLGPRVAFLLLVAVFARNFWRSRPL